MAVPTRIELAIFCVTGRRDNRYTTGPIWLRELDLNQRPLGYEPNELPGCSIPRYYKILNGGEGGIRTPAPVARPPGFQDQSLQPDLGTSPMLIYSLTYKMVPKAGLEPARDLTPAGF